MAVGTKETRKAEGIGFASKAGVVALRGGKGRNGFPGRGIRPAYAGVNPRLRHRVVPTDGPQRGVGNRVEHGNVKPNAVGYVVEAVDRIGPADVKNVERPAGLAVGVVFRHEHDINQPDRRVLIRAADGTVSLTASATVQDDSRSKEREDGQHGKQFRFHRISSIDMKRGSNLNSRADQQSAHPNALKAWIKTETENPQETQSNCGAECSE